MLPHPHQLQPAQTSPKRSLHSPGGSWELVKRAGMKQVQFWTEDLLHVQYPCHGFGRRLLRGRKNRKPRLDHPRLRRFEFSPLLFTMTWKVFQVNSFSFFYPQQQDEAKTELQAWLPHPQLPFLCFPSWLTSLKEKY